MTLGRGVHARARTGRREYDGRRSSRQSQSCTSVSSHSRDRQHDLALDVPALGALVRARCLGERIRTIDADPQRAGLEEARELGELGAARAYLRALDDARLRTFRYEILCS